jgi:Reverse transcriptase (RNA-dependent DNA polymerase)
VAPTTQPPLTPVPNLILQLPQYCATAGVTLVVRPIPPGLRLETNWADLPPPLPPSYAFRHRIQRAQTRRLQRAQQLPTLLLHPPSPTTTTPLSPHAPPYYPPAFTPNTTPPLSPTTSPPSPPLPVNPLPPQRLHDTTTDNTGHLTRLGPNCLLTPPTHLPRPHTTTLPSNPSHKPINLCTYNIISGRGERLPAAIRALSTMHIDVAILTETKLPDDIYTRYFHGYQVRASRAPSVHQGGVALIWKEHPSFSVESLTFPDANLLSLQLTTDGRRWLVLGVYLPPNEPVDTICNKMVHIRNQHPNLSCIVTGDLNVRFHGEHSARDQTILDTLDFLGVSDMLPHFRQRRSFCDGCTWRHFREGRWVISTCDYVLSDCSRKQFQRVRITDPRHYDSDHYAVSFSLHQHAPRQHTKYLRCRRTFPLHIKPQHVTDSDQLLHAIPIRLKHNRHQTQPRASWISDYSWVLIDRRAALRRLGHQPQSDILRNINNAVRKSIRRDRRRRTIEAGTDIEQLLADHDVRGAWARIKRWYQQSKGTHITPSPVDMNTVHQTFSALYSTQPDLPIPNIPINYVSTPILDTPPNEAEITLAVKRLRRWKAPGPSGFRTEDLLRWQQDEDQTNWNKCIQLIQHVFTTGEVPQRLALSNLVLLPKPDGGIRGIGLLETLWKLISIIIKDRILDSVTFDDALHGFLPTRGTSTAIIEAKLHLDTTITDGNTIYQIFIDLSKAYDSICRTKLLYLLQGYGLGPKVSQVLQNFWQQLWLAPKQGKVYGDPIKSNRGVTQGDPLSPILFNIVVDAVVREARRLHPNFTDINTIFYADDGLISGQSQEHVQTYLNTLVYLFTLVGLKTNVNKTKTHIGRAQIPNHTICTQVYHNRYGGHEPTYETHIKQQVICSICQKTMQRKSLPLHLQIQHDIYERPDRRQQIKHIFEAAPITYTISATKNQAINCPVPECPAHFQNAAALRSHFHFRHWKDIIHILEEGPNPLPRCPNCLIFCTNAHTAEHQHTENCIPGTIRHHRRLQQYHNEIAEQTAIMINEQPVENVNTFKYLGRHLSATSNDIPAIMHNLKKAKKTWGRI